MYCLSTNNTVSWWSNQNVRAISFLLHECHHDSVSQFQCALVIDSQIRILVIVMYFGDMMF